MTEAEILNWFEFNETALDLQFSPRESLIAAGQLDGTLTLYAYARVLLQYSFFVTTRFRYGEEFFEADRIVYQKMMAHEYVGFCVLLSSNQVSNPISSMHLSEKHLFTGDDEGCVKLWDVRRPRLVRQFFENEETISCIDYNEDHSTLIVTSDDCTFNVFDIRMGNVYNIHCREPLTCCKLVEDRRYLMIGDSVGELSSFVWSQWESSANCIRFKDSVECMHQMQGSKFAVGCGDGNIVILDVLSNKLFVKIFSGINMPINAISISKDGEYLAFVCDQFIKSYNLQKNISQDNSALDDDSTLAEDALPHKKTALSNDNANFFSDL